jgi:hypothetical protein
MPQKSTLRCCCGQDCAKCTIYRATVNNDDTLRRRAQQFYRDTFGREFPLEAFSCLGVFSDTVFVLCRECPWVDCCRQHGVALCEDCEKYPCPALRDYRARYIEPYQGTDVISNER